MVLRVLLLRSPTSGVIVCRRTIATVKVAIQVMRAIAVVRPGQRVQ
jgi:hypothetical protein